MGYFYSEKTHYMFLCGYVPRDAKYLETRNGKTVTSFSVRFDRHHNEDGQMVNEYMNVQMWGENAKFIGNEDIGISKGDTVLVFGKLVPDTYHKEGEPEPEGKRKVDAEIVFDMTSFYQLVLMVINGDYAPEEHEPIPKATSAPRSAPHFEETDEETPFGREVEEADGELPY